MFENKSMKCILLTEKKQNKTSDLPNRCGGGGMTKHNIPSGLKKTKQNKTSQETKKRKKVTQYDSIS